MGAFGFQSRDPEEMQKKDKLHQLKCKALSLRMQRNQLKAQIETLKVSRQYDMNIHSQFFKLI